MDKREENELVLKYSSSHFLNDILACIDSPECEISRVPICRHCDGEDFLVGTFIPMAKCLKCGKVGLITGPTEVGERRDL